MSMTEAGFEAIFDEHADALFRHAYFRVGSRERARDITQDTFIRAWDSIQKNGDTIQSWKPFLFKILNNLIIDEYRRKKTVSLDEMEESRDEVGGMVPDELMIGGLMEEVERADASFNAEMLSKALQTLPEHDRNLIVSRFMEQESIASLSDRFSITTDAVYVRIHRALKRLQGALITYGYEA